MTASTKTSFMQRMKLGLGRLFGGEPEAGMDALPVRVHGTEFTRTAASPVHVKGFDQPLVWVTFALLMFGLVMVYSASISTAESSRFTGNNAGDKFAAVLVQTKRVGGILIDGPDADPQIAAFRTDTLFQGFDNRNGFFCRNGKSDADIRADW